MIKEDTGTKEIFNRTEAAAFIRVSEKTLGEMARTRRIPSQKVGREWRFLRRALEAWLVGAGIRDDAGRTDVVAHDRPGVAESVLQYELPLSNVRDTAFSENHDCTVHRWVPWVAGFSGSFVAGVLEGVKRKRRKLRVLDPFAGVGTTLIEALKQECDAVGFEINPYAALACKAKVQAAHYDAEMLAATLDRFEEYGEEKLSLNEKAASPPPWGFSSRVPFFSQEVERQVLTCQDFIAQETTGWVTDLFQVAFGAVMVSFSNYSYEPSLGTRAGVGKPNIDRADVFSIVKRKLRDMHEDIVTFQRWMTKHKRMPRTKVYPLSYLDHARRITPHSIDVLITSPPYLNNYHYVRNTRPHLFWLGMVRTSSDLKTIERKSFGQFWQTVRSGPEITLRPPLPHLAEQLEDLRTRHAEKGAYGGRGWANYAAAYFNDCQRFCALTRTRMRPGGKVVVVIGNNVLQGMEFQTDKLFAEIAEHEGFGVAALHEVRKKRTGNSIVNSSVRIGTVTQQTRLYETAVELRSP